MQIILLGVIGWLNGYKISFMLQVDTLQITPEVLSLIAGIDEFRGSWRALVRLAPERAPPRRHH